MNERLVGSDLGAKNIRLTPRDVALYNLLHPELEIMLERLALVMTSQRPVLRIGLPQAIFWLRQLEEGKAKLKRIVADLSPDKAMLQDVLSKSSEACAQAVPCR